MLHNDENNEIQNDLLLSTENKDDASSTPSQFFSKFKQSNFYFFSKKFKPIIVPSSLEISVFMTGAFLTSRFINEKPLYWLTNRYYLGTMLCTLNFITRHIETLTFQNPYSKYANKFFQISRLASNAAMWFFIWQDLLHEFGHAFAASILFENANLKIDIGPNFWDGAETSYNKQIQSSLGLKLGTENSSILVNAAGMGTSTLISYLSLIAAQIMPEHAKQIKTQLRLIAGIFILDPIYYELSSYFKDCDSAKDACELQKLSVTPAIFLSLILGGVILLQLFLSLISKCKYNNQSNNLTEEHSDNDTQELTLLRHSPVLIEEENDSNFQSQNRFNF